VGVHFGKDSNVREEPKKAGAPKPPGAGIIPKRCPRREGGKKEFDGSALAGGAFDDRVRAVCWAALPRRGEQRTGYQAGMGNVRVWGSIEILKRAKSAFIDPS
jgi:hypothetical protein